MLFTGDARTTAEQRFLSEGVDLHAGVLKVGHHGSAYSMSCYDHDGRKRNKRLVHVVKSRIDVNNPRGKLQRYPHVLRT